MKTSNILAIAALIVFGIMPAASALINSGIADKSREASEGLLAQIREKRIHVVEIDGPRATPGLLSALPVDSVGSRQCVSLNMAPETALISGDTLKLAFTDPSAMFYGTIRIAGMREVIYPADTLRFGRRDTPLTVALP